VVVFFDLGLERYGMQQQCCYLIQTQVTELKYAFEVNFM